MSEICPCCKRLMQDKPSVPWLVEEVFRDLNIPRVIKNKKYPGLVDREDWMTIHREVKKLARGIVNAS